MTANFIIQELNEELKNLIETNYSSIKDLLDDTVLTVLTSTKDQFDQWYQCYKSNEITKEEFIWLLKTQQNIILLKTLQGKGISKIKQKIILEDIINLLSKILIKYITQLN